MLVMPLPFALGAILLAQSPPSRPEFEAASIHLNIDGTPYVFNGMKSPGTFSAENQTLRNLIQEAYGIPGGRRSWLPAFVAPGEGMPILGGPPWLGSDRWDITAKWNIAPASGPMTMQTFEAEQARMELMLQTLLDQRFHLKLHRESRILPVYEMTLTNPAKLKQATCTVFDPENFQESIPNYCGASHLGRKGIDWTLNGTGMKMSQLANTLSWLIGDRTIVDKTGYTGTFDAHLRWTPGQGEVGGNVPSGPDDVNESVFTVLQDQLGLRLKTAKGPVQVIVIDNVTRPDPN
jgi:uncharacterized protein (TIGR03435 family)